MLGIIFSMSIVIPTMDVNVGEISKVEAASKIKLSKTKATIYVGKTVQLKVKGTKSKVKWSSSKKSVATVSSKGKVKGKKAGTATITAKVGSKKYKCKVTVKKPKLNMTDVSRNIGDTFDLYLIGADAISYNSSNPEVVNVNQDGKVVCVNQGNAIITVKDKRYTYTCRVTVSYVPVSSVSLDKTNLSMKINDTIQITATVYPVIGTDKTLKWKSSNESVATVTQDGQVSAKSAGVTVVTVTSVNGKFARCVVTITRDYKEEYCNLSVYEKAAVFAMMRIDLNTTVKYEWEEAWVGSATDRYGNNYSQTVVVLYYPSDFKGGIVPGYAMVSMNNGQSFIPGGKSETFLNTISRSYYFGDKGTKTISELSEIYFGLKDNGYINTVRQQINIE